MRDLRSNDINFLLFGNSKALTVIVVRNRYGTLLYGSSITWYSSTIVRYKSKQKNS